MQSLHSTELAPLILPVAQLVQTLAPVLAMKLPAAQTVQLVEVLMLEYWPTTQSLHAVAPAPENVPTPQLVHKFFPLSATYLPAKHTVQLVKPVELPN